MTWHADEIILRATPKAVELIKANSQLAPFTYVIRSLAGHEWHRPEIQHTLPSEGLVVIRPVCGKPSRDYWYETPVLDWAALSVNASAANLLDQQNDELLCSYLVDDCVPPQSLRGTLASLAFSIGQPVLFYSCFMWAGDIEYEYCLVYDPAESVFTTKPTRLAEEVGGEDSLRDGLRKLGLSLPTAYFAPHVRSFPWEAHKLL